ncbi:MAG: hypothetical protein HZC37_04745 [Burkholderiales bacterium]|nr:hypothetical protein [Burkholderiales bacterium]
MSEQKPPKWFEGQAPSAADVKDWERRRHAFLKELPGILERRKGRGRAENFYPYLLVRSVLGDRGDRPFNACFWESPDIWTAQGDPDASPALPPDHGGSVTAGKPHTVYAHVWNLGFAPLAGIFVEFYWFDPSLGISGTYANLIGVARVELAGRGMQGSHKLVKCPIAWVPQMQNGGHECLVVRATGIGDPAGANEWSPWLNRHVAQRNITVVQSGAAVSSLLTKLNDSRPFNTRIQLIQLSAQEAHLAHRIAAPRLNLARLDTRVLGELGIGNELVAAKFDRLPTGALAAVHPMAEGGVPLPARPSEGRKSAVIDLMRVLPAGRATARREPTHLARLFRGIADLNLGAPRQPPPAKDEAQVVRLATYSGEQLVGGYTVLVTGR